MTPALLSLTANLLLHGLRQQQVNNVDISTIAEGVSSH
jgi:hypothetical protein